MDSKDPWTPSALPPGRRRRFLRELGGDPGAGEDAWTWLAHPARPGPSGAPGPLTRLGEARRAAFRIDAPPDAPDRLRDLETRLLRERAAARTALRAASWRPVLHAAGAVGAAAAAVLVAALLVRGAGSPVRPTDRPAGPGGSPRVLSEQSVVQARPLRTTEEERARLLGLFALGDGAALRMRVQSAVDASADAVLPADGSRTSAPADIAGGIADAPGAHGLRTTTGGAVTVALVVGRPVPWRATISFSDGTRVVVEGTTVGGRLQYALVLAPPAASATSVAFDLPTGVRYSWQVLHRG